MIKSVLPDRMPEFPGVHHRVTRALTEVLRLRADKFDVLDLVKIPQITAELGGWILICERLGKGEDDSALAGLLCGSWDQNRALREIPEHVLEAWLRMAERRSDHLGPDLDEVVEGIDMTAMERKRPDLIFRLEAFR